MSKIVNEKMNSIFSTRGSNDFIQNLKEISLSRTEKQDECHVSSSNERPLQERTNCFTDSLQ